MKSQWECVLQNLGEWHGSFTHFSPQGEFIEDIPSHICLESRNNHQAIHLVLRRFYPDPSGSSELQPHELVRDFNSVGAGALFFDSGAFSEGGIYFSTHIKFGAEFCLVQEPRRLRIVLMFNPASQLDRITLIREKRPNVDAPERPPLTLDDLLGTWQGEAISLNPGAAESTTYSTKLTLARETDDRLIQHRLIQQSWTEPDEIQQSIPMTIVPCPSNTTHTNSANLNHATGSQSGAQLGLQFGLQFAQNNQSYQQLLLPDGAFSTCPMQITPGHAFSLEIGWLLQPRLRQRLIRDYNADGTWNRLTLITESRVG